MGVGENDVVPAEIPTVEPTCLTAGDTWAWTRSLSDYPATDWQLNYTVRGPTDIDIDWGVEVSADGADFAVEVAPAKTATLVAGRYSLYGYVTDGTDRHTVYSETLLVTADPTTAVAALTVVEELLDQVNAAIKAFAGSGSAAGVVVELEVQGDRKRYASLEELYDLRARLHEELAALRRDGSPLELVPVTFNAW